MTSDRDETQKLIDGIKIPPAPFIVTKLQEELQKDDPILADVANIVAQDVAISALVLRTVNSAFFGLRVKVNSIQQATSLLGIHNTLNIVTGLALRRTFETSGTASPPNFWDSPANVAMVSAKIARVIGGVPQFEAYMLGLFHNAGHGLLMQKFSDYPAFLQENLNSVRGVITDLEEQQYNTNHAVLGYFLARSWGLERDIVEIIRDHHNAVEKLTENGGKVTKEGSLLAILKMAEHIDKLFWSITPDHEWEQGKEVILGYVGMSEPDFDDLRDDMSDMLISG